MLALPGTARIFVCRYPMSMHKSFEGLSAVTEELFPHELFTGAFFVFINRLKTHAKVLFWDGDGLVIWYKRLEKGTFSWKWGETHEFDRRAFLMLLEGVTPKRVQRRFSL